MRTPPIICHFPFANKSHASSGIIGFCIPRPSLENGKWKMENYSGFSLLASKNEAMLKESAGNRVGHSVPSFNVQ
jgi:hypothetical protein